jgi:RNA polymerase sigma-70 factor (ECF subfamily)
MFVSLSLGFAGTTNDARENRRAREKILLRAPAGRAERQRYIRTVAQIAAGCADRGPVASAFMNQLYEKHGRSIVRRATAILGDRITGKDIMKEVLQRAAEARAAFTAAESQVGWLYRLTTELCLNRLREGRRPHDISRGLGAVLQRVPHDLQEIAVYYLVDRMSPEEISTLLAVPVRTIGHRLEQFRSAAFVT